MPKPYPSTRHGHCRKPLNSPEYNAWAHMKDRCFNPRNRAYSMYGGKGITVCERWLGASGFENFLSDMGLRPSNKHSIDRYPDPFGSYCPDNCRWATQQQQGENKRNAILVTIDNQTLHVAEWVRKLGLNGPNVYSRIKRGMNAYDALTKPFKKRRHRPSTGASYTHSASTEPQS